MKIARIERFLMGNFRRFLTPAFGQTRDSCITVVGWAAAWNRISWRAPPTARSSAAERLRKQSGLRAPCWPRLSLEYFGGFGTILALCRIKNRDALYAIGEAGRICSIPPKAA